MIILKAIGAFFSRLWRWIKETAWVQPLLIVGAIFAIIFSIPKITNWVGSLGIGSANSYYNSFKYTLENENDKFLEYTTAADKLTHSIDKWSNFDGKYDTYHYADYLAAMKADKEFNPLVYGEKFFLVYVKEDCSGCETAQPGFDQLQIKWDSEFAPLDGRAFNLKTIYADESSTNDDDYDSVTNKAFVRYLNKFRADAFFSEAGERLHDAPYTHNAGLDDSEKYTALINGDADKFELPTILLIDFSEEAFRAGRPGVSEVLFGVSGSERNAKATLLQSMWNHTAGITWDGRSSYNNPQNPDNKFSDFYNRG